MLLVSVATLLATVAVTAQAAAVAPIASNSRMKRDYATGFEWDPENFKVAAVRKPPVGFVYHALSDESTWWNYDLNATVAQSVEMIHQAAAEGTKFIAFPELYFPGYPAFRTPNGPKDFEQYVSQTMEPDGPEWNTLMQAFADTKMYGVVGWAQRANDSLFMTQSLVGPLANGSAGTIWKHEKFRPSGTERSLYSDGLLDTIRAQKLPFGTVSMLQCWEHVYPESHFIGSAQPANLHVASFPFGNDVPEADGAATPYAYWRAAAIGYQAGAAGSPVMILPTAGAATIFAAQGSPINESLSNSKESTDSIPYITAVYNTTALWQDTSYSVNAWYSYGALKHIIEGLPDGMPRRSGPFFGRILFTIQQFTSGYIWPPTLSCTPTSRWPCMQIWPERVEKDFMA
ncbi:carbon-nitrogen hydrolase [Aspergillus costaricaensis CBS 115574]|uniref:Carbon-nitrogen hydrolase n=1 Tax=Aspergillus costaricaensis CBS 115574 TaxID=1448317 RepID=A0ACD1IIP3_9EURO|nr:carbon-nitrogen hydrolase [Aspergillus costaricaensis CBS 115574]RAK90210.1 carbon-nitrogen hydrolase [Aspergillus costaricaensis CBS 115574]